MAETIKLADVQRSAEAWQRLVKCRITPATAYKLRKYVKHLADEQTTLEEQRIDKVKQYGTADPAGNVAVSADNIAKFQADMQAIMATDTDLKPVDMTMDALVAEVQKTDAANALSVEDMLALEPFFKPSPTDAGGQ